MATFKYSATVNGNRRSVILSAPSTTGADEIETIVDNDARLYDIFYRGATDAEKDPDAREDVLVERFIQVWVEVDS